MIVLNFSHPLTPAGTMALSRLLNSEPHVVDVAVQLNLDAPVQEQLDAIVSGTLDSVPDKSPFQVSYIIPPALGAASAYVGRRFPDAGIILVAREGATGFVPTQILVE